MNCKQAERILPLLASRDLDGKTEARLRSHLDACKLCSGLALEYQESLQWLLSSEPPEFDEEFTDSLRRSVLAEIGSRGSQEGWFAGFFGSAVFRPAIAAVVLMILVLSGVLYLVNKGRPAATVIEEVVTRAAPDDSERSITDGPAPERRNEDKPRLSRAVKRNGPARLRVARLRKESSPSTTNLPALAENHSEPLRIDLQTSDPTIKIIWFVSSNNLQSSSPMPGLD